VTGPGLDVDAPAQSLRGAMVGTPGYMSPEQADPAIADVDTRTDVYSLGLVLYELLVGHHALKGLDRAGLPPPPSSLVPNVDPRLERIVMQALSPLPGGRPASAMAVAAAVEGHFVDIRHWS